MSGNAPEQPNLAEDAVTAVASVYYERAARAVDDARQRAQTAFTMSSGIAAAVAAAGLLADLKDELFIVQLLAVASFAAWLVTSGLLLVAAVAEFRLPFDAPDPDGTERHDGLTWATSDQAFITSLFDRVNEERDFVYDRLRRALVAAGIALLLTASALPTAIFTHAKPDLKTGVVVIDPKVDLTQVCDMNLQRALPARFETERSDDDFVEITLSAGACKTRPVTLQLPSKSVVLEAASK